MSQTFEQEIHQMHAEICGGLADPKRILILYALADSPRTVTELAELLNFNQPSVSRHLKLLRERRMVTTNRIGASVQYTLGDVRLIQALDLLRAVLASKLHDQAALANSVSQPQDNQLSGENE